MPLSAFPYLGFSLIMLMIGGLSLLRHPEYRRTMVLSGLLCATSAAASIFFDPEYWNPVRIVGSAIGVEDVIFSFANGMIVWAMVTWRLPDSLTVAVQPARCLARYLTCVVTGLGVFFPLWLSGLKVMPAALAAIATVGTVTSRLQPHWWWLATRGSIGFGLLYAIALRITMAIWPGFLFQWNLENLWGVYVLGLPLEELVWAFGFGAVWPLIMAYAFDTRLDPVAEGAGARAEFV